MKFSTYDRDNDLYSKNCAVTYRGAWWYRVCDHSNLNADYHKAGRSIFKGMRWGGWNNRKSIKKTEMKIRPAGF
jgi:hypothetical protein